MADDWRWRTCPRCQRRFNGPRNDTWLCKTCELATKLKNRRDNDT